MSQGSVIGEKVHSLFLKNGLCKTEESILESSERTVE